MEFTGGNIEVRRERFRKSEPSDRRSLSIIPLTRTAK
jgi:hypothetical protein